MPDGLRRFLILCFVFTLAFIAVFMFRSQKGLDGLGSFFSQPELNGSPHRPESYSLQKKPALDLSEVQVLSAFDAELAKLTNAVTPSVVSIDTAGIRTERFLDLWGQQHLRRSRTTGLGSGVIVSKEGHIITNHHVIEDKQSIRVTLHDQKSYEAKLIGEDRLLDIAVLRIQGDGPFPHLKFGDSDQVRVGQLVFAVGNPFGLGETVTQGIISAKERSLNDTQRDLFQTDAAINPGNSGGPLVNVQGEVIGINVAIYSSNKDNPGFQGVGFSIPINDALASFESILKRGTPVRGFLGVQMAELNLRAREVLRYEGKYGAVISSVTPDSPAQDAGLQRYDILIALENQPVKNMRQVLTMVQRTSVGEILKLKVWRKGEVLDLTAKVADAESAIPVALNSLSKQKPRQVLELIGMDVRNISMTERMHGMTGVVVSQLRPGAVADSLGIRVGDEILSVNKGLVSHQMDFYLRLTTAVVSQSSRLRLRRGSVEFEVTVPMINQ